MGEGQRIPLVSTDDSVPPQSVTAQLLARVGSVDDHHYYLMRITG